MKNILLFFVCFIIFLGFIYIYFKFVISKLKIIMKGKRRSDGDKEK